MTAVRRVVTGKRDGKSVVLSDGPAPNEHTYDSTPGMIASILWAAEPVPNPAVEETAPVGVSAIPDPGHSRFIVVEFPPDAVMADPSFDFQKAIGEQLEHLPNFVETFEPSNPGIHTTPTVDYAIVLTGTIWLELDEGSRTQLEAGDVVVQQRTRHAWRNLGSEPARLGFVMIGTDRS